MRHGWGLSGAIAIAAGADVAVVIDVLSFTTTVTVAADAGIAVLPYADTATAAAFARRSRAVLAAPRATAKAGQLSLSPASIRAATSTPERLVLPSPNGSSIAHRLATSSPCVVGACLRNADAVSRWIDDRYTRETTRIAVISAGERWPDGSLRPCLEDLYGAGVVLSALAERGWTGMSPEAQSTRDAYRGAAGTMTTLLRDCASGRELIAAGYPDDVAIATEIDASTAVPILRQGAFTPHAA